MRIIWACGTRTGSEFAVKLTRKFMASDLYPYSAVTPGRVDTINREVGFLLRSAIENGKPEQYFRDLGSQSVKIEEPGRDDLLLRLCNAFPDAVVVTTFRKIENIVVSHHNLPWGHSEKQVLVDWRCALEMFEMVSERKRLFVIDIDHPSTFSDEAFAAFLDSPLLSDAKEVVREWRVQNDLKYQQGKSGLTQPKQIPAGISSLRTRYYWIDEVEEKYRHLVSSNLCS